MAGFLLFAPSRGAALDAENEEMDPLDQPQISVLHPQRSSPDTNIPYEPLTSKEAIEIWKLWDECDKKGAK